jgi:hypothetical protein
MAPQHLGTAQLILTIFTVLLCIALFIVVIVARVRGIRLPRWVDASSRQRRIAWTISGIFIAVGIAAVLLGAMRLSVERTFTPFVNIILDSFIAFKTIETMRSTTKGASETPQKGMQITAQPIAANTARRGDKRGKKR